MLRKTEEYVPARNENHVILEVFALYLRLLHDHNVGFEDIEHCLRAIRHFTSLGNFSSTNHKCPFLPPWLISKWIPVSISTNLSDSISTTSAARVNPLNSVHYNSLVSDQRARRGQRLTIPSSDSKTPPLRHLMSLQLSILEDLETSPSLIPAEQKSPKVSIQQPTTSKARRCLSQRVLNHDRLASPS